jgi:hypothetical protein
MAQFTPPAHDAQGPESHETSQQTSSPSEQWPLTQLASRLAWLLPVHDWPNVAAQTPTLLQAWPAPHAPGLPSATGLHMPLAQESHGSEHALAQQNWSAPDEQMWLAHWSSVVQAVAFAAPSGAEPSPASPEPPLEDPPPLEPELLDALPLLEPEPLDALPLLEPEPLDALPLLEAEPLDALPLLEPPLVDDPLPELPLVDDPLPELPLVDDPLLALPPLELPVLLVLEPLELPPLEPDPEPPLDPFPLSGLASTQRLLKHERPALHVPFG